MMNNRILSDEWIGGDVYWDRRPREMGICIDTFIIPWWLGLNIRGRSPRYSAHNQDILKDGYPRKSTHSRSMLSKQVLKKLKGIGI
jgi:hypothetical protein